MKNLRKLSMLLILGLLLVLTGCSDNKEYKKEEVHVNINDQIVFEKDDKTLANGTLNYKSKKGENISVLLLDGQITSFKLNKNKENVDALFKNKILVSLKVGENSNTEYFDDGSLKYIYNVDSNAIAEIKYKETDSLPYYLSIEAKPSNRKILLQDNEMIISKLDTSEVLEKLIATDNQAKSRIQQMGNMMKHIAKASQDEMYVKVLKELIK